MPLKDLTYIHMYVRLIMWNYCSYHGFIELTIWYVYTHTGTCLWIVGHKYCVYRTCLFYNWMKLSLMFVLYFNYKLRTRLAIHIYSFNLLPGFARVSTPVFFLNLEQLKTYRTNRIFGGKAPSTSHSENIFVDSEIPQIEVNFLTPKLTFQEVLWDVDNLSAFEVPMWGSTRCRNRTFKVYFSTKPVFTRQAIDHQNITY